MNSPWSAVPASTEIFASLFSPSQPLRPRYLNANIVLYVCHIASPTARPWNCVSPGAPAHSSYTGEQQFALVMLSGNSV